MTEFPQPEPQHQDQQHEDQQHQDQQHQDQQHEDQQHQDPQDQAVQDDAAPSSESATPADVQPAGDLELPHTGDEKVDQALERLLDVPDLPPADQVEVYVGVHRDLQDRLADLEG